jgi:hypothetical protein
MDDRQHGSIDAALGEAAVAPALTPADAVRLKTADVDALGPGTAGMPLLSIIVVFSLCSARSEPA